MIAIGDADVATIGRNGPHIDCGKAIHIVFAAAPLELSVAIEVTAAGKRLDNAKKVFPQKKQISRADLAIAVEIGLARAIRTLEIKDVILHEQEIRVSELAVTVDVAELAAWRRLLGLSLPGDRQQARENKRDHKGR